MSRRNHIAHILASAACALAGGCASNPLSLPPLPASLGVEAAAVSVSSDPPIEVYARIARGALKCWFGAEGSLKKTHVFHAKVDPPSAGGAAEIAVHTRDSDSGKAGHAALRAYRVDITTAAGGSHIEAQNVRFPEAQGADMNRDVSRWAAGGEGCSVLGTGGWAAAAPPSAPPEPPKLNAKPTAASPRPAVKQP